MRYPYGMTKEARVQYRAIYYSRSLGSFRLKRSISLRLFTDCYSEKDVTCLEEWEVVEGEVIVNLQCVAKTIHNQNRKRSIDAFFV